MAGRTGDIGKVRAFRKNLILPEAANSAEARTWWPEPPDIDVWLIWLPLAGVQSRSGATGVEMDEPFRIYRDSGVVLKYKGAALPQTKAFIVFLQSPVRQTIFVKWGGKAS